MGLLDYGYRGHRLFGHSGDIEGALDFLSDELLCWSERPGSAKSGSSVGLPTMIEWLRRRYLEVRNQHVTEKIRLAQ